MNKHTHTHTHTHTLQCTLTHCVQMPVSWLKEWEEPAHYSGGQDSGSGEERSPSVPVYIIICNWGRTPLHNACLHKYVDVATYLITQVESVDIHCKDNRFGATPLDMAAEYCPVELAIKTRGYEKEKYNGSDTPFHHAARGGNIAVVKLIVRRKAIMIELHFT